MRSDVLLICDDDVIPLQSFVQFFCRRAPSVRGYRFLPHRLNEADPHAEWSHYEHVRFLDDDQSEELVRFLHVDTCLIPRDALQELVKVALPDSGFELVGD